MSIACRFSLNCRKPGGIFLPPAAQPVSLLGIYVSYNSYTPITTDDWILFHDHNMGLSENSVPQNAGLKLKPSGFPMIFLIILWLHRLYPPFSPTCSTIAQLCQLHGPRPVLGRHQASQGRQRLALRALRWALALGLANSEKKRGQDEGLTATARFCNKFMSSNEFDCKNNGFRTPWAYSLGRAR